MVLTLAHCLPQIVPNVLLAKRQVRYHRGMCVTDLSCVSQFCHMCHGSVVCVTDLSCVSRICHACHGSVICITDLSCVSRICRVCHGSVSCVTDLSCVTGADLAHPLHGHVVTDLSRICRM